VTGSAGPPATATLNQLGAHHEAQLLTVGEKNGLIAFIVPGMGVGETSLIVRMNNWRPVAHRPDVGDMREPSSDHRDGLPGSSGDHFRSEAHREAAHGRRRHFRVAPSPATRSCQPATASATVPR